MSEFWATIIASLGLLFVVGLVWGVVELARFLYKIGVG